MTGSGGVREPLQPALSAPERIRERMQSPYLSGFAWYAEDVGYLLSLFTQEDVALLDGIGRDFTKLTMTPQEFEHMVCSIADRIRALLPPQEPTL